MTWVPIKGALKKARTAAGLTQRLLSQRADVNERTIKLIESAQPPARMRQDTYDSLMGVLKRTGVEFVRWVDSGDGPAPAHVTAAAEARPSNAAHPAKEDKLPARSTVSLRAQRERALQLHDVKVRTPHGELPLLGLTWFKLIWSRPKKYDGMRFVALGCVEDHQGLNRSIRKTFQIDDGGKYLLVRWLDEETPYYATVFAFSSEHADALTPVAQAQGHVATIVRVQYSPPVGEWKGFTFFGKDRTSHEFAFICEAILPDRPTITAAAGARVAR